MHLADAFIQRDLHYIQGTHLSSMNQTHDLAVASALLNRLNNRKALPLLFQIILAHQKMVSIHVLIVYVLFRWFDTELHVLYDSITRCCGFNGSVCVAVRRTLKSGLSVDVVQALGLGSTNGKVWRW